MRSEACWWSELFCIVSLVGSVGAHELPSCRLQAQELVSTPFIGFRLLPITLLNSNHRQIRITRTSSVKTRTCTILEIENPFDGYYHDNFK